MGVIRVHLFGIFLAIICIALSQGNHRTITSQQIDENKVEQLSICCRKELDEITKAKLYSNHNPKLPRMTLKRSLLQYLKSKRYQARVSGRDECEECISKLYNHNIQLRNSHKIHHHQRTKRHPLGFARKAASSAQKDSTRLEKNSIRVNLKYQQKPPDHVILIGIVVSTAVASLALFLLFLFCCLRGEEQKLGSDCAENDGEPIVEIRSTGSSQTSQPFNDNKDLTNSLSTKALSHNGTCQTPKVEKLPIPPGRMAPSPPSPPPPPAAPPKPPGPKAPPPPPIPSSAHPPGPPKAGRMRKPPAPPCGPSTSGDENDTSVNSSSPKTKLKPLFWDKMNTSPNQSMVWNEVKAGSFQIDEEMMESLFGYASGQSKNKQGKSSSNINSQPKFIQIIDPRKAQNLAITLKALTVTTDKVCSALKEGTDLPVQLISTLIKMPPTQEEEVKLRLYNGDLGLLGPADHLLKILIEIPFVYKRLEALLFMSSLHEESSPLKDAFRTLEVSCTKLKNSRLFLKLLEAVLKMGNRMNIGTYRGGAQAIKLDSLLKLSDVKGTDGKTTLLTFVVQEIIRSEGIKNINTKNLEETTKKSSEYYWKVGLDFVSQLSNELQDVKKAAIIDGDHITSTVLKLGSMLKKTKDLIKNELNTYEEAMEFCDAFNGFMEHAEMEITWMLEEEKRIMALVKSTGDYFHGNSAKDEGIRLFVIVRDFLKLLDKVCIEIKKTTEIESKKKSVQAGKKEPLPQESRQQAWFNIRDKLFPALKDRKMDYISSDEEDTSPSSTSKR